MARQLLDYRAKLNGASIQFYIKGVYVGSASIKSLAEGVKSGRGFKQTSRTA